MSVRLIAVILIFIYACILCWQYEARKIVDFFSALNLIAFLVVPFFLAGAVTGLSAAILLTVHQWKRASLGAGRDPE